MEKNSVIFLPENPFSTMGEDEKSVLKEGAEIHLLCTNESIAHSFIQACDFRTTPKIGKRKLQMGYFTEQSPSDMISKLISMHTNGHIIVLIGYGAQVLKSIFDAMQFGQNHFRVASVQNHLGCFDAIDEKMISAADPFLRQLHIIGNQAPYTRLDLIKSYAERGLQVHRLGLLRQDLGEIEPEIRAAEVFSVDLQSIRSSDRGKGNPIGFHIEEICQLAHYAGRGEYNRFLSLYGFDQEEIIPFQLLSQIIWYYLQGLGYRSTNSPDPGKLQIYAVEGEIEGMTLEFYKDEEKQKWWLKCPMPKSKHADLYALISCNYADYSMAVNEHQLSDRLRYQILLL